LRPAAGPAAGRGGPRAGGIGASALRRIFLLLLVNALLFSVLGGALLTRYLLPMYPLVLLVAVTTFYRRVPYWQGLALFAAAFVAGPVHQSALRLCPGRQPGLRARDPAARGRHRPAQQRYPGATVLSAWPMTDELTRPELGYLKQPWDVYRLEDFTAAQIARAAAEPEKYSAALVFSTKYDPLAVARAWGLKSEALDERSFGLHHDLPPEAIARELGGTLVWKKEDQGQWVALIRLRPLSAWGYDSRSRFPRRFAQVGQSPAAGQCRASNPADRGRILLVLPFDNRTGQPSLEWIREAAADLLGSRFRSAGFEPMSRADRRMLWTTWACRRGFSPRAPVRSSWRRRWMPIRSWWAASLPTEPALWPRPGWWTCPICA
jgi:hypothetical protein